ncbi:MAG TPA: SMP-30/gluconolactonase/LRE family protein [Gammaproteobacteria bacterium]|nr:SMP-30/gluconolactonase/LRE family protein [Gammaproteobacteria bacterium]
MSLQRFVAFVVLLGCAFGAEAQQSCEPSGDVGYVCGVKNPEDLVLVPGTTWIVSSGMAEGAGFYLVDSNTGNVDVLPFAAQHDPLFAGCTTPPTPQSLNTHGLNIRAMGPGRAKLYVVGHGAREAIEVFDVDATAARPTLTWRGCVPMPEGLAANSVASFADGSLVATVLFMPGKTFADSVARRPTGAVFEWSPGDSGFTLVEGTELPANNGIEVSADGREIYVASSGLQTIVAFSHSNPARQLRTTRPLPFTPDNVHLGADGRLLTAGMANDVPECGGAPGPQHDLTKLAACPRPTIAVAIDPATMRDTVIATTPADAKFSNATMVLTAAGRAWIGTFSGDKIARAPLR